MANLSYKAASTLTNRYGWNGGNEYEDEGELNYSNTFYRKYDAQIGRFTGVDMLAEVQVDLNPYHFGGNNPVMFNDPRGDLMDLGTGRMKKGTDNNYHVGWFNDFLQANADDVDWGGSGGGGGNGGGGGGNYSAFWNTLLGAVNNGNKVGKDKNGAWGFWSQTVTVPSMAETTITMNFNRIEGAEMHSYTPTTNWAEKWDRFNNINSYSADLGSTVSRLAYGIANSIWTVGSQYRNKSNVSLVGDNVTNMKGQRLVATYGKSGAETQTALALFEVVTLPLGLTGAGGKVVAREAASGSTAILLEEQSVFIVTKEGVVLPKGGIIPSNLVENQFRSSTYGIGQGSNFVEKLRIDPARFAEPSHFHVNGQGNKLTIWRWF